MLLVFNYLRSISPTISRRKFRNFAVPYIYPTFFKLVYDGRFKISAELYFGQLLCYPMIVLYNQTIVWNQLILLKPF